MDVRAALNLVNLSTPAGVLLARAAGCRLRRGPSGLVLASGWSFRLPKAAAFTVGNVVLYRERAAPLLASGTPLLAHESRHSTQYALLGPAFLPLYLAAAAWSVLRTGNPGTGNPFERLAGLRDGGYPAP